MTFQGEWRPRSHEGKSPRLSRALRLAEAYVSGHYEPDGGAAQIESVMPVWADEIRKLDGICAPNNVPDGGFFDRHSGCLSPTVQVRTQQQVRTSSAQGAAMKARKTTRGWTA